MIAVVLLFLGVIALYLANEGEKDWAPRECDQCGAPCEPELGYCECDPDVCPYPAVQ